MLALGLAGCAGAQAAGPLAAPTTPAAPPPASTAAPVEGSATLAPGTVEPAPAPDRAALPADSGRGRRVVYSISGQRTWLVQDSGEVERTYHVSGRPSQPDPGSYRVYSRSRHAASAVSNARMQYMVRFARGERTGAPIGFHDIPREPDGTYEQTEAQLGQPLSAGCIRQSRADAVALWDFAPVGTAVVVVA